MPGLVGEISRLQEEFSELKAGKNRLKAEKKVVPALETKTSEFITTTGSLVVSLQEVQASAIEINRDPKTAWETITLSNSFEKALTERFSSLTEDLSSVRVERLNLRADSDEMTALVQQMEKNVGKSLSNVSTEVQKTYKEMVDAVKQIMQENLVHGWKNTKTHFHVKSVGLVMNAGDELLRCSLDMKSSLGQS